DAAVQAGVGREPVHGGLHWLDDECPATLTQTVAVLGSRERHERHHAACGWLRSSAGPRGRRDGHALLARARKRSVGMAAPRVGRGRESARWLRGSGLSTRALLESYPGRALPLRRTRRRAAPEPAARAPRDPWAGLAGRLDAARGLGHDRAAGVPPPARCLAVGLPRHAAFRALPNG